MPFDTRPADQPPAPRVRNRLPARGLPRQPAPPLLPFLQMRRHFSSAAWGAVSLAGMLASCRADFHETAEGVAVVGEKLPQPEEPADLVLSGVAFVRSASGRIVARGTAATASWRQSAGKLEASGVDAKLARGSQGPAELGELTLLAPKATGELSSKSGIGWGGVELRAARGDRARSDRVLLDGAAGEVLAPGPVDASGPGYKIHGSALTARSDGTRVELTGGVRGTLTPKGAGR